MKKLIILILGLCFIVIGFFIFKDFNKNSNIIEGEILVSFQNNTKQEEVDSYIKSLGLTWDSSYFNFSENTKVGYVKVPAGDEKKWIEIIKKDPIVKYAELKYITQTN